MGRWNRRNYVRPRRRNYYHDYNWSPPREEPCPDPETEVWQDNVPMWEKKFCYLVGRMPWKKVLSTKNYIHCHNNILTWDDSAGKEAFDDAKKRFWDEFIGLPCETQSPNPDMYIDEINWNPCIDPELSKELDRVYFNPDDKYYLPAVYSSEGNNEQPEDSNDPWERDYTHHSTVQDKAAGWSQWDDSIDKTSKLTKNNDPWESHHTQKIETKDTSWGGACNTSWGSKRNDHTEPSKNWKVEGSTWNNKDTGWRDRGASSSNWNQNKSFSTYKTQEFGTRVEGRGPNGTGNSWGKQHSDDNNWDVRGSENMYRGRGRYTSGCRKREGPDYHAVNCKGPRIQGGVDYQSSRNWNADNNRRVSFGGRWS